MLVHGALSGRDILSSKASSSASAVETETSERLILNPYESVFITKPTLSDEDIDRILEKLKSIIEEKGGEVVSSDNWGKKKLAYEVQKERKGIYVLVHFKGTGDTIAELERTYRFTESIIKFMNVRIDPENLGKSQPVREDKAYSYRGRESRGWR